MEETNPMVLPVDGEGNAIFGAPGSSRATIKGGFTDDGGASDSDEDQQVIDRSKVSGSGAVVPLGNIDDAEVYTESMNKPKMKEKKNSKWGGKGESLTTETALQFMIKERAMMDLETAKLKRENEELRRGLDRGKQSNAPPPSSSSNSSSTVGGDKQKQSDAELKDELKRVKHENEVLKLRQMTEGLDASSAGAPIPVAPNSSLVQKGPLLRAALVPGAPATAGLGLSSYTAGKKMRPDIEKVTEEEILTISARLWDGGYLWKIPYNGKGDPDKRIVALKRAKVYPSPGSRAVIINRGGVMSKPENFIVFPPTLVWYNSDKPGEVKNARELILYEGSCLMEGHNTNAFHKLLSRDKRVPPPELCFSMMTSTRSLDLAADRMEDASDWKDALHMLLVELCPNKEWAKRELRRSKPFWNNSLESPPAPAPGKSSKGGAVPAAALSAGPQTGKGGISSAASAKGAKPLRKEAIKKQVFNACRAGDSAMVESMFKAGVPPNLSDDKSNGDTPLFVACQIGDANLVEVCLQYGAKNDPHPDFGETALHVASRHGHIEAAKVILAAAAQSEADGMICNLTNEEAQTPLHLAARSGHKHVVELLLGHGAAIDCKDELEQTVLHVASGAGHRDVVATILDHGGDHLLEFADLGGSTPLHYAAQTGHLFVIKILLETAADATARTMQGQTAYKLAMDRGHTQIATLLLEYMKDYKVSTALPSGATAKKNAANTSISRTGRLTIDVNGASAHVDEEELLAQGLGVSREEYEEGGAEVSLQINSHLPPSPKSSYGTPNKGIPPPPGELPRPHTQSSPGLGHKKSPFQTSPIVTTPQKGLNAYNGTEVSPGVGAYRVLDRQDVGPPHTSPVQTGLPYMAASPQQQPSPGYGGGGYGYPQQHSAREGYNPSQHQSNASEMYSPLSARERPAPAMFEGMSMQQQQQQQQHGYPQQHAHQHQHQQYTGSTSPPPHHSQQPQPLWNPNTQQWEYPQAADHYNAAYHASPQQGQHQQYYSQSPPPSHDASHSQQWGTYQQGQGQGQDPGHGYPSQQQPAPAPAPAPAHQQSYEQEPYGTGIAEQASVAVESYEEALEEFECLGRYWSVYKTEEGHLYYLDASDQHSQWEDPREVGVQVIDYEEGGGDEHGTESGGVAFHSHRLPSPKASPPKSPSPKAGSAGMAARRAFFSEPKEKGDNGTPVVTRLFDDSDPFTTIVEPGEERDAKASPPGEVRVGWTNGISPDTSEDEADEAPRIVIKDGKGSTRARGGRGGGRGREAPTSTAAEPSSPSRMTVPVEKLPPHISTTSPEQEKEEDKRSGREEGRGRDRDRDRSASRSRSRSRALEAKAAAGPTSLSLDSKLEAIAKRRASKSTSTSSSASSDSTLAEAKEAPAASDSLGDKGVEAAAAAASATVAGAKGEPDAKDVASTADGKATSLGLFDGASSPEPVPAPAAAKQESREPLSARKARYVGMLEQGESLRVVRREMEGNEEPKELIKAVIAMADEVAPVGKAGGADAKAEDKDSFAAEISGADAGADTIAKEDIADLKQDPVVGKYAKMAAMGIPGPAVAMKMRNEGVEEAQRNRILAALDMPLDGGGGGGGAPAGGLPPLGAPRLPMPAVPAVVAKEELADLKQDPVVGKYAKMAAMGVPHASVQAKMRLDNVEVGQVNRILRALDIEVEDDGAGPPGGPPGLGGALAALAAGPGGKAMSRRPSVPMQTMHWDAIPKDKLEKSIWASAVDADEEIKEDDMAEIEKLFGKEDKKGPRGAWGDGGGAAKPDAGAVADTKPKKDRLFLIDGKRAQNVTIGLSQFKSVGTYKELIRAVCSLDSLGDRLSTDHLENLRNILPNATEVKNCGRMTESLHPAEEFLCTAAQYYPDLPLRLDCFITCCHFGTNCAQGLRNARKVVDACNEVISSDKLARVLQKMLAVGNIMNQGTFRGNATGFTVDSLLRMINMKGADKKTSVLDYVVKSLYDRGEEKVLVVADDLVVVEECARMSGKEITRGLSDLLGTFDTLKDECEKVKERRAGGGTSPTPRQPDSGSHSPAKQQISSTSELFVAKLDHLIAKFRSKTDDVAKVRALVQRKVAELVEYFGEDEKECDTTSIFSVLQQFRKALNESKATAERKMRSAAVGAGAAGGASSKRRSSMA